MKNKRGISNWIWRALALVIAILIILGFYLLLSGNFSLDFFNSDDDEDSSSGSWFDNLGGNGDSEEDPIPKPPVLPN